MPNSTGPVDSTHTDGLHVSFTVPGEPVSKSRARFTKRGYKTVAFTPEKTKAGELRVALAFRQAKPGHQLVDRKFYGVEATFYCGTRQRRDVDNMLKLILDGLNNVAYLDDNSVTDVIGRKRYVDKAEARTEVIIYELADDEVSMKQCAHCGNLFRTYDSTFDRQKYCSRECAYDDRVRGVDRTCEHCGEIFHADRVDDQLRFCSTTCKYAHGRTEVECTHCSKRFEKPTSHVRKSNYCSDECRNETYRIRAKDRRSAYFPGTCVICGVGTTKKKYTRCSAHRAWDRAAPKTGQKRGPYKKGAPTEVDGGAREAPGVTVALTPVPGVPGV